MQHAAAGLGVLLPDAIAHRRPAPHVRNRRRAERWHRALWNLTGHRLEHATTEAEVARIIQAQAEQERAGPAFARIWRNSVETTPAATDDRESLGRILQWFDRLAIEAGKRDRAWASHDGRKRRRTISRVARAVLAALVGIAKRHEHAFPSLERLAALADCCRRTAFAVLATLEAAGVVTRHRRYALHETPLGRRARQATNAYTLALPHEKPGDAAERMLKGAPPPAPAPLLEASEKPATATADRRVDVFATAPIYGSDPEAKVSPDMSANLAKQLSNPGVETTGTTGTTDASEGTSDTDRSIAEAIAATLTRAGDWRERSRAALNTLLTRDNR